MTRALLVLTLTLWVSAGIAHAQTVAPPDPGFCFPAALAFGAQPASGSASSCWRFGGTAGDRVRVRVVSPSGTPTVSVSGASCTASLTCTLTTTGSHAIGVGGVASYTIAIQRLNDPAGCTALAYGPATSTGAITSGETECWRIPGAAGDRVRLRLPSAAAALDTTVELLRPDGTTRCGPATVSDINCTLDAAGTHTILVRDAGAGAGGYSISVQRLNNPAGCGTATFGPGAVPGTIATTGEADCWRFNAIAGDRVRVRLIRTSGAVDPRVEVVRPAGTTACWPNANDDVTCLLDADGVHTLIVADLGNATGSYRVSIQRLNAPVGCSSKPFGPPPAGGAIATTAETDCWRFDGTGANRVRVRTIATSGALTTTVEVIRPDGTTVCGPGTTGYACDLDENGTHTILVRDWTGTTYGDYNLALQRLPEPAGCSTTAYGTAAAAGSIAAAGELDCWTFAGDGSTPWRVHPGDHVRVRVIATSGSLDPIAEVVGPYGTTRCAPTPADDFDCTLDSYGSYAILVRDTAGRGLGAYRLAIQRLEDPVGCSQERTGSVAPGETACLRFHSDERGPVRFHVVRSGWALDPVAEVVGPDGGTVCPPTTADRFTCEVSGNGWHTLLVRDAAGANFGAYGVDWQRLDHPSCTTLFRAGDQNGSIDDPGEIDCFTFRNSGYDYIGDDLIARVNVESGDLDAIVEVIDHDGTTLCAPRPAAGGYFLCHIGYGGYDYAILVHDDSGTGTGGYEIDVSG